MVNHLGSVLTAKLLTDLTIDVVPGRGSGFSLETTENKRFITRSRLYTDDE